MKVFQKDLAMIILFVLFYDMITSASVHSDYHSGAGGILPLPQEVCEARFSVLPLCLPANKNLISLLLLFNACLSCWSNYGRVGGGQTVSVMKGGCMWKGVIQHELEHALGFLHEHSRSDRDKHVKIMWEYISPGKYFKLLNVGSGVDTSYCYQLSFLP